MPLLLTGDLRSVPADTAEFCAWLSGECEVERDVIVTVAFNACGLFFGPGELAAPRILVLLDGEETETEVFDTIAHETVHYEQYRDGRNVTERGVARRAAALVRKWERSRGR